MSKSVANSVKTTKPRGKPWKPGESGNPAGRPKSGASWSEIFKEVGEQYPEEVTQLFGSRSSLGRKYAKYTKGVQMKYQVAYRVVAELMSEPTPGLLKETLDRIEGKVKERIEVDGSLNVENLTQVLSKVYGDSDPHSG
jgi:hypothetical protein